MAKNENKAKDSTGSTGRKPLAVRFLQPVKIGHFTESGIDLTAERSKFDHWWEGDNFCVAVKGQARVTIVPNRNISYIEYERRLEAASVELEPATQSSAEGTAEETGEASAH